MSLTRNFRRKGRCWQVRLRVCLFWRGSFDFESESAQKVSAKRVIAGGISNCHRRYFLINEDMLQRGEIKMRKISTFGDSFWDDALLGRVFGEQKSEGGEEYMSPADQPENMTVVDAPKCDGGRYF